MGKKKKKRAEEKGESRGEGEEEGGSVRAVSPREHRGALIFCGDGGVGGRKSSTRGNAKAKNQMQKSFSGCRCRGCR